MNERLKELRKALGLTMEDFGSRLGVAKSTISCLENGTNKITNQMIVTICLVYNVNETWLREGEGEMFVDTDELSLDEYLQRRNATDLEKDLMRTFFSIDSEIRVHIIDAFKDVLAKREEKIRDTADNVEVAEEEYKKSLGIAPGTRSSASNITKKKGSAG